MRKLIIFSLAISICLLLTGTLFAQETGQISGKVFDEEGTPLPGVSILATSPSLQGNRSSASGNDGSFRLPLLPIGKYTLAFELQGFARVIQENVGVRLGMVTSINVSMKVATIDEQITVMAQAPLIDKTKADTSFNVGERELASAPIQARTIQEIVHYTPGVTSVRTDTTRGIGGGGTHFGGASFRGEGETSNNWFVDGLSTRETWEHREGVRVNYDSWEEVQIISDPLSPELGQTFGGLINIVTKTGGNEFHGELGALILDHSLRASRQEQLAYVIEPERSTYNYFGNIGGPIIKDKLWFFISDNFWHNAELGQAGSFGWLSFPEGKKRTNTNNFFGKLTFALAQNHTISLSGTYDKFLSQSGGIGLPERYIKENYKDYAYRLNYKGIFGSNTLIEVVIGKSSQNTIEEPLSGETGRPPYYFADISQYTNNSGRFADIIDRRTDFTSRFTQYLNTENFGNHEIGLGFLYYNIYKEDLIDFTGEDWDCWPNDGYDAGVRLYFSEPGVPTKAREDAIQNFHNRNRGFGLYLQDKVTIGRLSVMFGIRAETAKIFNDLDEEVINWGLGDYFSPRFSLAWDITGDGVNVLKIGAGQFVDTAVLDYLGYINLAGGFRAQFFNWIGPTPIQDDQQLRDPSNWVFSYRQGSVGIPAMTVHEDATPDKMTRVIVEFDRLLGPNWALKLRGVYSNHHDMLEDLAEFTYESETWKLQNWDLKRRNYRGFEVEVNGRLSDKLFLNSSYVWSKAKGTTAGAYERNGMWSTWGNNTTGIFGDHYSGPADSPLAWLANWGVGFGGKDYGDEGFYGVLPYSCDHVVKILATYIAPYGFNITAGLEWYSGYYYSIRGLQKDYNLYWTFPHGRGTEKAPAHSYLDLSIQKDFALPGGVVLGLRMNVTNLFNSQEAISFMNGEGSVLFGQVYGRQHPRWFQFQALLRF